MVACGKWSPEELAILREMRQTKTPNELASMLNRTPKAVRNQLSRMGVVELKRWTEEEVRELSEWYDARVGRLSECHLLSEKMGRSVAAIRLKAFDLGYADRHRTNGRKVRQRKFASDAERFAALSEYRKKHIAEHGHPRGALGLKHSEEMKQNQSERVSRYWRTATDEQKERRLMKRNATNLEIYGTANPGFENQSNPYSRSKRGYAEDLGARDFFRSMWEANYARYLDWLKEQGEIQDWQYEPQRFVFHGVTRAPVTYCPDFRITERDGSTVFHEVKGWMDSASKSKLKRMAKYYPDVRVVVVDEVGYKSIAKLAAPIVPHWGDELVKKEQ